MNEPQNEDRTALPETDEQASPVVIMQRQITFLLLAVLVISGTLTLYLFYQAHVLGRQLETMEPQARYVVENYDRNWPHIQRAIQELIVYGQKHPDFQQQILKKYGIPLTLPVATNSVSKPPATNPTK